MRCFSAVLFVLVACSRQVLGQEDRSQFPSTAPSPILQACTESSDEISNDLMDAYGEENCELVTYDNYVGLECSLEVPGYTSTVTYNYSDDPAYDNNLRIDSIYSDGGLPEGYSVDFEDDCFDSIESLLFTVESNRLERDCSNSAEDFQYTKRYSMKSQKSAKSPKQKTTSCETIGQFNTRKMRRFCNTYPEVSEACRGLCRTGDYCVCEQNPFAFPLRNGSTTTCEEFAAQDAEKITRKCQRYKYRQNCPAVCGCTLSDPAWAKSLLEEELGEDDGIIVLD